LAYVTRARPWRLPSAKRPECTSPAAIACGTLGSIPTSGAVHESALCARQTVMPRSLAHYSGYLQTAQYTESQSSSLVGRAAPARSA
jgi:hypothetical protein